MGVLPTRKTPARTDLADLTVLIYGAPKIGKSTFCSQGDRAVFLATEAGLNHLETYQVPVASWPELLDACAEIAAGEHNFRTVIIDTIDNALQMCEHYVCERQGIKHPSDLDFGKGYSLVTNEFTRVLIKLSLLPYGLYLISHAEQIEVKTRTEKYRKWVPSLSGKARKAVLSLMDIILYADIEDVLDAGGHPTERRVLRTKPTTAYEAGDRTGRLPDTIPLDYQAFTEAFNADPFRDQ
jgi:hypothetical protein